MTLSVIIPVYNVEHTLDRCVESVVGQGNASNYMGKEGLSMEVILVDDGSPDNCPRLCDEWANRDSRIKVIHKENGGLSDARNAGLDVAQGEYVTFVDSDDYLLPGTYGPLMEYLQKNGDADILEYAVQQTDSSRLSLMLEDKTFPTAREYWHHTRAWQHSYAWNKIYRRTLFDGCRYQKDRLFEDLLLLPQLLKRCRKVITSHHGMYVYTVNDKGLSKQVNLHTEYQLLRAELHAAITMGTMPWSENGSNLYYYICCRCFDLLRLSVGK